VLQRRSIPWRPWVPSRLTNWSHFGNSTSHTHVPKWSQVTILYLLQDTLIQSHHLLVQYVSITVGLWDSSVLLHIIPRTLTLQSSWNPWLPKKDWRKPWVIYIYMGFAWGQSLPDFFPEHGCRGRLENSGPWKYMAYHTFKFPVPYE
jgi:hypothetical protein